jgi:hypothetical protein
MMNEFIAKEEQERKNNYLNEIETMIDTEKMKVRYHATVLEALQEKAISTIKSGVSFNTVFNEDFMRDAWMYDQFKSTIMTKKYSKSYKYIKSVILDTFFANRDVKLLKITTCGADNFAYTFDIEYHGIAYVITIPLISKMSLQNYELMNRGKITVGYCVKDKIDTIEIFSKSYDMNRIIRDLNLQMFANDCNEIDNPQHANASEECNSETVAMD